VLTSITLFFTALVDISIAKIYFFKFSLTYINVSASAVSLERSFTNSNII